MAGCCEETGFCARRLLCSFKRQRHGVRPLIEKTYPLDEVRAALARLEAYEQFGKTALAID